jgi:hypothetical protein
MNFLIRPLFSLKKKKGFGNKIVMDDLQNTNGIFMIYSRILGAMLSSYCCSFESATLILYNWASA